MLKEGDLAIIKTSGEVIYISAIRKEDVEIIRPVQSKDGIRHEVEVCREGELESVEDHFRREALEAKRKRQIFEEIFGYDKRAIPATDISIN